MLTLRHGRFNGHPPLGVNATSTVLRTRAVPHTQFQWAPTLGGECYTDESYRVRAAAAFQWAPTLGGECYTPRMLVQFSSANKFQWAPTLGGECYLPERRKFILRGERVSMGTHPWG